jgi:hypothetical protein
MTPGTIFISHRSEYANLVRGLKEAIQQTSKRRIEVFVSEDIPPGDRWRKRIEDCLSDSQNLFLLYGAPYEDWTWCFYEAGYFSALIDKDKDRDQRHIYCIARPNSQAPGPLSDLQLVTNKDQLIERILDIYAQNNIEFDAKKAKQTLEESTQGLFGQLAEYTNYPWITFTADNSAFTGIKGIPNSASLSADGTVLNNLFGIAKPSITWATMIQATLSPLRSGQEKLFAQKWLDETSDAILAARDGRFVPTQTVLVGPGGRRFRFLLLKARIQGDGVYCCEFLAVNDVGGPTLGLPDQLLSLLTSIRMSFRFRYEFIQQFGGDPAYLSDDDRRRRIDEIPRIIGNLTTESEVRGNVNLPNFLNAFESDEQTRLEEILNYWPLVQGQLYRSLGLNTDGILVDSNGLTGDNIELFRKAFKAARLLNREFLARCCNCVSRKMTMTDDELKKNEVELSSAIEELVKVKAPVDVPQPKVA